jgi:hypothetical protein
VVVVVAARGGDVVPGAAPLVPLLEEHALIASALTRTKVDNRRMR